MRVLLGLETKGILDLQGRRGITLRPVIFGVEFRFLGRGSGVLSPYSWSVVSQPFSGPNRAMQLRCAMRFESHTPKSLAMRKSFFASDAKTHQLDLK